MTRKRMGEILHCAASLVACCEELTWCKDQATRAGVEKRCRALTTELFRRCGLEGR